MSFFPSLAALAAGLQVAVSPSPATDPPPASREKILVTAVASRVEEALDATPATVSVIGREELERGLARDIRDALRYEPGVSVENAAARFGLGNIAIRGLEGNRVQMLLDGVRMPDGFRIGSFSNASRNPYDMGLLSRIEILRGPASALYGSDALGGVVSMGTLDPRDLLAPKAAFGGFADAGYAEADRSARGTAAVAGRLGRVELLAGASVSRGHERENQGEVEGTGANRTAPNPQDTRGESQLAKMVVALGGGGHLRATYDRFERDVATDVLSLNPQSPRTVRLAGDDRAARSRSSVDGVHYGLGPVDKLSWTAYAQRSTTEQDTDELRANTTAQCLSAPGTVTCRREATFTFRQREAGVTAIGQSTAGKAHQLVYGAEWSRNRAEEMRDGRQTNVTAGTVTNVVGTDVFPTRDFPNSRIDRAGGFVQDEIALAGFTLVPALRYDRFEMLPQADDIYVADNPMRAPVSLTDSAWSPKIGALIPLGPRHRISLQAATGFRAPPYFDTNIGGTAMPLGYAIVPNPDLKPEKSRGLEAGLRGAVEGFDYSLTAFRTDYSDLIVSRAPLACPGNALCVPGAPITFQSQNVTRARIEGVEARAEARLGRAWTAKVGAAWARGDDRTKGKPLNSIDPAKLVAGLAWTGVLDLATPMKAGAQLHVTHAAKKSRIDSSAGTLFATPSYTVADLTAHIELTRRVTLFAGAWNLTDRKYWLWSDVRGIVNPGASIDRYTQPGRTFGVQAKVVF